MREEKHKETLDEVLDEIESATKNGRGLLAHQRRLAFALSLGVATLIELYFHKLLVMKEGSKIDHRWLKRGSRKIKEAFSKQITKPIEEIPKIDLLIKIAAKIEEKRDDLAYGSPASEKLLQEKINLFFELKKLTGV